MSDKRMKVPLIRFAGFSGDWEEQKAKVIFKSVVDKGYPDLPVLSASQEFGMIRRTETKINIHHDVSNEIGYKRVIPGQFVIHLRSFQGGFAHSSSEGITSPAYTVLDFQDRERHYDYFWKYIFKSELFIKRLELITYGIRDGRSISYSDFTTLDFLLPTFDEEHKIGQLLQKLDNLITLHQRQYDKLATVKKTMLEKMFPKDGANVPEIRFVGFTGAWEERKLGKEFTKVNERNDGSFGKEHWISVAKMYFQDPEKVQSNNIDTRTYVMRVGDIAFEGHPNREFKFGRFVANDIGDGVVSELFPIYRHKLEYDNDFWKRAIQIERMMAPIYAKSITSSGNSSNKLDEKHFSREIIPVPEISEQKKIGSLFRQLDTFLTLQQREINALKDLKKSMLQQLFV